MLATPAKNAGPLPFVAADVSSFGRWRQSGGHLWKPLSTPNEIIRCCRCHGLSGLCAGKSRFNLKVQLMMAMTVIENRREAGFAVHHVAALYLMKSDKQR